jgi:hypothetical protein
MSYRLLLLVALLVAAGPVIAQETITLTTPETKPSNAAYRLERLTIDADAGTIHIQLKGQNGEAKACLYHAATTPTGATLIIGLNKANLPTAYAGNATTGSLTQRIFHRLVVLGEGAAVCSNGLAGTVTGTVP